MQYACVGYVMLGALYVYICEYDRSVPAHMNAIELSQLVWKGRRLYRALSYCWVYSNYEDMLVYIIYISMCFIVSRFSLSFMTIVLFL